MLTNSHAVGLYPQTQKLQPSCTAYSDKQYAEKTLCRSFQLSGHSLEVYPQTQMLDPFCTVW